MKKTALLALLLTASSAEAGFFDFWTGGSDNTFSGGSTASWWNDGIDADASALNSFSAADQDSLGQNLSDFNHYAGAFTSNLPEPETVWKSAVWTAQTLGTVLGTTLKWAGYGAQASAPYVGKTIETVGPLAVQGTAWAAKTGMQGTGFLLGKVAQNVLEDKNAAGYYALQTAAHNLGPMALNQKSGPASLDDSWTVLG